ncbi:MAG: peptidoglycan bridge formation glycyltransferase FemA/FemB family protein, partial [Candidatus Wolfebacteria bacterium]|nr:peptidoglycan bridge formation glycyltransferase FemA/FemB family protein [Candidatus Wolfebacteria bacterium]
MAYDLIGLGRREEGIYLENWPARKVIGPAGTDLEKLRYKIRSCPQAEDAVLKTVCLPTGPNIKEKDAERVANFVRKFCESRASDDELNEEVAIREIDDKKEWEKFLEEVAPKTFLQSWNWGEFDRSMGKRIWRLGIYNEELGCKNKELRLVGVTLVEKISARRGKFLYIPHGPVFKSQITNSKSQLRVLVSYLKKMADMEKCD